MTSAIGKKSLCNPFKINYTATEHEIQVAVIEWCKIASIYGLEMANNERSYEEPDFCKHKMNPEINRFYCLKWIYAIPNGGMRNVLTRVQLNKEGVSSGYPDLGLDVARHMWHGLRIELKACKGKISPEQKEWHDNHLSEGYYSVFCYSFIEARNEIIKYLS